MPLGDYAHITLRDRGDCRSVEIYYPQGQLIAEIFATGPGQDDRWLRQTANSYASNMLGRRVHPDQLVDPDEQARRQADRIMNHMRDYNMYNRSLLMEERLVAILENDSFFTQEDIRNHRDNIEYYRRDRDMWRHEVTLNPMFGSSVVFDEETGAATLPEDVQARVNQLLGLAPVVPQVEEEATPQEAPAEVDPFFFPSDTTIASGTTASVSFA